MLCFVASGIVCDLRAEVQPAETAAYYLPGFTQRLRQVKFGLLEGHSSPAILASDGNRLALFATDTDDCLFETTLDSVSSSHCICFADADHDGQPDILIGYYYDPGAFLADTVCKLQFYSSISSYDLADSSYYTAEYPTENPQPSPWSFVELLSLDTDGDNIDELFFSYDRYRTTSLGGKLLRFTSGHTRLYDSFPESVAWERPVLLGRVEKLSLAVGPDLFVTNRYRDISLLPEYTTALGWVEITSGGGDSLFSIGPPAPPSCAADSNVVLSLFECLAVGDMNLSFDGPELLVRTHYQQTCWLDGETTFDRTETAMRLYSVTPTGEILLVWSDLSPEVTSNFRFLPESPGYFFSAQSARVGQHSGLDGEPCYFSDQLNADTLIWCDNPEIIGGPLVAIRNQTLSIYRLDVSTGVDSDLIPDDLPSSFELGTPYPNPFNSSCLLEYSLPNRAHIRIGVYNVLGQRVRSLVDETRPAGRYCVYWDGADQTGNPVATGVYLFKMQAGSFSDSKKVLLLK